MKVLVWNNIWAVQASLETSINCFKNCLSKEANLLASKGFDVDVVIPNHLKNQVNLLEKNCRVITFSVEESYSLTKTISPLEDLYRTGRTSHFDLNLIAKKLAQSYDLILTWELPTGFLKAIYPDALIVNQMPGVYSRAPSQNLITIDPQGLYKSSLLFTNFEDVYKFPLSDLAGKFKRDRISFFRDFLFFEKEVLPLLNPSQERVLLPLQVSSHFNFIADARYQSQLDFLVEMLVRYPEKQFVVTQYVTPNVKDTILTPKTVEILSAQFDNFIYSPVFDTVQSVSELILPKVDTVCSCSSSLGLQGVILGKSLIVPRNTYIKPFDYRTLKQFNLSSKKVSDHLLSFLLDKYTVNFDFLSTQPDFFVNLLEELKLRKNNQGLEKLISYSKVSETYESSFNEDRKGRASKIWKPYKEAAPTQAEKMYKLIRSESIKVVSFDIFDTLINRPLFRPTDLFLLMEPYVQALTNGRLQHFSTLRVEAEKEARTCHESKETTLKEIYKCIQNKLKLSENLINKILEKEENLELSLCMPNSEGLKLFNYAQLCQKKVVFTSDMYLSDSLIRRMLTKCGYINDSVRLYLSSKYGCSKVLGGALFSKVIDEENVHPSEILHIGDKGVNDVENAKIYGITANRLISVTDRLKAHKILMEEFNPKKSLIRSMIFGLVANNIYFDESKLKDNNSLTHGEPYNLGYICIGPFILGYLLWLNKQVIAANIKDLYFLAREGKLLQDAFSYINSNVKTHYLLASRRALYGASIFSETDINIIANLSFEEGAMCSDLLKSRFGLIDEDFGKGKTRLSFPLKNNLEGKERLFNEALAFKDIIFKRSSEENKLYLEYLNREGMLTSGSKAIVDIGWQGRMQARMEIITNKKLKGFYYATTLTSSTNLLDMSAYLGNISNTHPSVAAKYRKFIEYFICAPTKSFQGFTKQNGILCPCFVEEQDYLMRSRFISSCHQGAIDFVRDFVRNFGVNYQIDYSDAEFLFSQFIIKNKFQEIAELAKVTFIDEVAGVKAKNLFEDKNDHSKPRDTSLNDIKPKIKPENASSRKLEKWLISNFATEKMQKKYKRNPDEYIRDSKSVILKFVHGLSKK